MSSEFKDNLLTRDHIHLNWLNQKRTQIKTCTVVEAQITLAVSPAKERPGFGTYLHLMK